MSIFLLKITAIDWEVNLSNQLIFFVFFSTVFTYNFIKYLDFIILNKFKVPLGVKFIVIVSLLFLLGSMILFFLFDSINKTIIIFGILIIMIYVFPILNNNKNIRNKSGVKIYWVAIAWVVITVILPLSKNIQIGNLNFFRYVIHRFLWILVATIPFEIRDLSSDSYFLKTLPQKFGIRGSKVFGMILITVMILIFPYDILDNNLFLMHLFLILSLTFFLLKAKINQNKYYSSFWVESIPLGCWIIFHYFG